MENKFQTSFIPKREFSAVSAGDKFRSVSILSVIAVIMFVLSIALSAGIFAYQKVLVNKVKSINAELVKSKESFDPSFIQEVSNLNRRIDAAKDILGKHISASAIFDLLEKETLASVRFKTFSFALGTKGTVSLSMNGEADGFDSVALQSDVFGGDKFIKNPIFNNLNLDERGSVSFQFKASLDPKLLLYKEVISTSTKNEE